jgi:hypothetical protein
MKSREVRDTNNVAWSCVQAFSGTNGDAAKRAAQLSKENSETVEVICTPSGGAQTVRLNLDQQWLEKISDDDLVTAIVAAR